MRVTLLILGIACIAPTVLTGCVKKSEDTVSSAQSDSLIASSPIEPPSGELTPQAEFEPQQNQPNAAPKPKRRPTRAPSSTETQDTQPAEPVSQGSSPKPPATPGINVQWGSFLHVAVANEISTETARVGDTWSGTLTDSVVVGSRVAFPAGSTVQGTVKESKPAGEGDRATLTLELTSIDANGQTWPVKATSDPVVAGSPRARNLGAIVGGTAAGALIGSAVGGKKGGVVGGLLGGAAAGGAVARSKGYQVVIKPGARMTFTTAGDVIVRP